MGHGSEKRARTAHLTIRLTPDERAVIDQAAEGTGLTAGSYARQLLLGAPAPRQVRWLPLEKRELVRLLGLFGNLGSNINQIARAANSGDGIDAMEFGRALGVLILLRDETLRVLRRDI